MIVEKGSEEFKQESKPKNPLAGKDPLLYDHNGNPPPTDHMPILHTPGSRELRKSSVPMVQPYAGSPLWTIET